MKKTCNNCKWLYKEHCCNGVSDMCTKAVSSDDSCDKWELGGVNVNAIEAVRRQNKKVAFNYLHGKDIAVITLLCEEAQAIIEALGKQIPSKVINVTSEYDGDYGSCASCKNIIYDFTSPEFCKHCGQKLNWR